jgi:hypothetical protein
MKPPKNTFCQLSIICAGLPVWQLALQIWQAAQYLPDV